jgi:hypothetical protein
MELPSAESRLETELSSMIGRYGTESVHKALVNRMRREYSYLKIQFEDKKREEPVKKSIEVIKNEEVVKNEVVENVVENEGEKIVEVKQENKKSEKSEKSEKSQKSQKSQKSEKFRNPKEVKEWQRVQEDKKLEENRKKGVLKKEVLTKENLKKWIEEEGHTFSYIAREFVGCRDTEVSAAAKLFGISKKIK